MTALSQLWLTYLLCADFVLCLDPDSPFRKYAIRDADWALDNYFDAVERELMEQT